MLTVREPSFKALQDVSASYEAVKFRYESSKNTVIVDVQTANAITACHKAGNDVSKAKIERMVKGSVADFQRVAAFCLDKMAVPVPVTHRPLHPKSAAFVPVAEKPAKP